MRLLHLPLLLLTLCNYTTAASSSRLSHLYSAQLSILIIIIIIIIGNQSIRHLQTIRASNLDLGLSGLPVTLLICLVPACTCWSFVLELAWPRANNHIVGIPTLSVLLLHLHQKQTQRQITISAPHRCTASCFLLPNRLVF